MGENFLDRLKPAEPTPTPTVTVPTKLAGNATAYAVAALKGEVANIQAVPIGAGRNDQLNRSAVKMYGYAAAGAISERDVTETLGAADGGLDYPATARTLQSARDAVYTRLGPKAIPEPTRPQREVPPWEMSDDPFSPHFVPPSPSEPTTLSDDSGGTPVAMSGTSTADSPTAGDAVASSTPDPAYAALVQVEAGQQRIRRDARRLIDQEDAVKQFRQPEYLPTLTDELLLPDDPVTYRVDRLLPTGGNVLLAAQFKAGKTTLMNNLARALADKRPFLGRYDVNVFDGRVVIFNYEVDRSQYRRWLRDVGIDNTDGVAVLPLRGYRLPLLVPHVEQWVVDYLKAADAAVWIVDPFARAASGSIASENDNTEVGAFLEALDVIKRRAGVSELILPTHTGRAEHEQGDERARGATRLDDWADVRWLLTKDTDDTRYFRATGRDVDTDEAALAFDTQTRTLTVTGGDRTANRAERRLNVVLTTVRDRPGIGVVELRNVVKATAKIGTTAADDAVARAIESRKIHQRREGHSVQHFIGPPQHAP